jgi:hypothetical protein
MTAPPLLSLGVPTLHAKHEIARRVWPQYVPENAKDNVSAATMYAALVGDVLDGRVDRVTPKEREAIERAADEVLGAEWRDGR